MKKVKALITIIAVIFLGFIAYNRYSLPLDATLFTPDSFYAGMTYSDKFNPKDYYLALHGLTFTGDEDSCDTTLVRETNTVSVGTVGNIFYTDVKDPANTPDPSTSIGDDGSGTFTNGSKIIMPFNGYKFKNSNLSDSTLERQTNGRHDIEIIGDDGNGQYIVVFEDVMTWWCHQHKPSADAKHNLYVGDISGSSIKSVAQGFVIGIAKDTTKVKVYRIKDEFYNDATNPIKAGNVEYDTTVLEQIKADKFFIDGTAEFI